MSAGSGLAGAVRILDGNVDTYWEPDLDDPQDLWVVAIDLGRIVSAKHIVLRFAREGEGDPFYQFRLMVADGEGKVGDNLDYHLVGKTERPNVDQREFSFDLQPFQSADPHFTGDAFRFVQVVMTDSRWARPRKWIAWPIRVCQRLCRAQWSTSVAVAAGASGSRQGGL